MPDITKGKTFVSGETVTATDLNSLVDGAAINNLVVDNAKLAPNAVDNAKVSATAAIAFTKLATLASGSMLVGNSDDQAEAVANVQIPVGAMMQYCGMNQSTSPSGWLFCAGSNVSRTTYAALYIAIGDTYGEGDGSTTFTLPDMRGRVGVGIDGTSGRITSNYELGQSSGLETHTLTPAQMPAHNHGATPSVATDADRGSGSSEFSLDSSSTVNTGGGEAHNNLQPYLIVNWMIKT